MQVWETGHRWTFWEWHPFYHTQQTLFLKSWTQEQGAGFRTPEELWRKPGLAQLIRICNLRPGDVTPRSDLSRLRALRACCCTGTAGLRGLLCVPGKPSCRPTPQRPLAISAGKVPPCPVLGKLFYTKGHLHFCNVIHGPKKMNNLNISLL